MSLSWVSFLLLSCGFVSSCSSGNDFDKESDVDDDVIRFLFCLGDCVVVKGKENLDLIK